MYSGEQFEAFARPLRKKSAKQIRELAQSEGYKINTSGNREFCIQELYACAHGLPHPLESTKPDVGSPAAQPVVPPTSSVEPAAAGGPAPIEVEAPAPVHMRRVRCRRPSYWCAGVRWSGDRDLEVSSLTGAQWREIRADKQLMVRDL